MRFGVPCILPVALALAVIAPDYCAATGCPTTLDTAKRDAVPDVEAAAIAWGLGSAVDWPVDMWMCVTRNGAEPAGVELLSRLRRQYPLLAAHIVGSGCKTDDNGRASYLATGARASLRYTTGLEFPDATHATVSAGMGGCGDLCGSETKLFLECGPKGWQVARHDGTLSY